MSTDKRDLTNWEAWEAELQRVYIVAQIPGRADSDAYRDYYNDEMAPAEAYLEDLSNA